jgi:hypothetical protein
MPSNARVRERDTGVRVAKIAAASMRVVQDNDGEDKTAEYPSRLDARIDIEQKGSEEMIIMSLKANC